MAVVVASIGLSSACAQQAARLSSAGAVSGPSAHDRVTAAELASGGPGDSRSVLAALQRARPSFLGTRGRLPAVSIDESVVTDISILSTLTVSDICEIQLQRATSGAGHAVILSDGAVSHGDVLVVRTRRSGDNRCGLPSY
jgi:hypothetical protein